jgi:hypothetical protein
LPLQNLLKGKIRFVTRFIFRRWFYCPEQAVCKSFSEFGTCRVNVLPVLPGKIHLGDGFSIFGSFSDKNKKGG